MKKEKQNKSFEREWLLFKDLMMINKDEPERMKPILWTLINDYLSDYKKELIEEIQKEADKLSWDNPAKDGFEGVIFLLQKDREKIK